MSATDVPAPLEFVNPSETEATWRICLWAAPGQGKSVAAASAPTPILVLSADRPSAYRFARKLHGHGASDLREVRYQDAYSLDAVFQYLGSDEGKAIRTVVLDPVSNIYDQLVDTAPQVTIKGRKSPDYQLVNKKLLGFVKDLRRFDVNLVLVAHEKIGDSDDGDGKLYPALGGPSLINKLLAEMDVCAHIERVMRTPEGADEPEPVWIGQIQPRDNLVCKDGTNALGDRRVANLTRWIELATEGTKPDESDLPWAGEGEAGDEPDPGDAGGQFDLDEARAEA